MKELELVSLDRLVPPWPGPRPYREREWRWFYGRGNEVKSLLERVQAQKMTLVLGKSGAGKTSLLSAGLVAALRNDRYHPKGDRSAGPVLLMRRWGGRASASFETNLLYQIESAIDAIEEWGRCEGHELAITDAGRLRSKIRPAEGKKLRRDSMLEIFDALASDQGDQPLILMFDQFEEQLRAGSKAAAEALTLIYDLVTSGMPVRLLLSLREEYRYALRTLEVRLGQLAHRSLHIEPMQASKAVEIIAKCTRSTNLAVDTSVATRLVSWLSPRLGVDTEDDKENRECPDLLHLQAILLEASRFSSARGVDRLSPEIFEQFTNEIAGPIDELNHVGNEGRRATA